MYVSSSSAVRSSIDFLTRTSAATAQAIIMHSAVTTASERLMMLTCTSLVAARSTHGAAATIITFYIISQPKVDCNLDDQSAQKFDVKVSNGGPSEPRSVPSR